MIHASLAVVVVLEFLVIDRTDPFSHANAKKFKGCSQKV